MIEYNERKKETEILDLKFENGKSIPKYFT